MITWKVCKLWLLFTVIAVTDIIIGISPANAAQISFGFISSDSNPDAYYFSGLGSLTVDDTPVNGYHAVTSASGKITFAFDRKGSSAAFGNIDGIELVRGWNGLQFDGNGMWTSGNLFLKVSGWPFTNWLSLVSPAGGRGGLTAYNGIGGPITMYVDQLTPPAPPPEPSAPAVPEPATWAMMMIGFGLAGFALRRSPQPRAYASRTIRVAWSSQSPS